MSAEEVFHCTLRNGLKADVRRIRSPGLNVNFWHGIVHYPDGTKHLDQWGICGNWMRIGGNARFDIVSGLPALETLLTEAPNYEI